MGFNTEAVPALRHQGLLQPGPFPEIESPAVSFNFDLLLLKVNLHTCQQHSVLFPQTQRFIFYLALVWQNNVL